MDWEGENRYRGRVLQIFLHSGRKCIIFAAKTRGVPYG